MKYFASEPSHGSASACKRLEYVFFVHIFAFGVVENDSILGEAKIETNGSLLAHEDDTIHIEQRLLSEFLEE